MIVRNITETKICLLPFLFLFYFTFAQASTAICEFDGIIHSNNPRDWEKLEFSILLKDKNAAGYLLMVRFIGEIAVTNSSILRSPSCKVSKYITALIEYYDKNKLAIQKKSKNIADLLDFIKLKINIEQAIPEGGHHEEL